MQHQSKSRQFIVTNVSQHSLRVSGRPYRRRSPLPERMGFIRFSSLRPRDQDDGGDQIGETEGEQGHGVGEETRRRQKGRQDQVLQRQLEDSAPSGQQQHVTRCLAL